MKRVNVVVTCAAIGCAVVSACSVFEEPILDDTSNSGGQTSGSGGSTGGTSSNGGNGGASGGNSPDASATGGATQSGGGGGGTSGSGGKGSGGSAGGSTGGAPATGPFWIETDAKGCEHKRLPNYNDRPAQSDASSGDLPPIYLAISRARHGASKDDEALTYDPNGWLDIGFDLDGKCTNSPTCENGDGTRIKETVCKNTVRVPADGNDCIDNAIGQIINIANSTPLVADYFGLNDPDWNCELHRGGFTTIIKISNYNGKLNDRDVRVDQYVSTGLQDQYNLGYACRKTPGDPLLANWWTHATWQDRPNAHFKVADRSIDPAADTTSNELPDSIISDPTSYVRNGYVFSAFPDGSEFWWNGENTPVPGFRDIMHHPVALGKLVQDPGDETWSISEGYLTSVVLPGDMIKAFREIGYCENMCAAYESLKGFLTSAVDVFRDPEQSLPDSPCSALSIAITYQARQVTETKADLVKVKDPVECPQPRNPHAPRQGCVCGPSGECDGDGGAN